MRKNVDIHTVIGRTIFTRTTIMSLAVSMKRSVQPTVRNGIRPSVSENIIPKVCSTCGGEIKQYRCSFNSNPWIRICPHCSSGEWILKKCKNGPTKLSGHDKVSMLDLLNFSKSKSNYLLIFYIFFCSILPSILVVIVRSEYVYMSRYLKVGVT